MRSKQFLPLFASYRGLGGFSRYFSALPSVRCGRFSAVPRHYGPHLLRNNAIVFSQPKHSSMLFLFFRLMRSCRTDFEACPT